MQLWYSGAKYMLLLSHNDPRLGKCRHWEKVISFLKLCFFTISCSASPPLELQGKNLPTEFKVQVHQGFVC